MNGPAPDTDRPRRTVPAGAFVVTVMVAAALGVLAVVALATGDGGGADREQAIRLAAGRFTERFLTFEHDALDEWEAEVLALATPGFAEEVDEVRSGLRALIGESRLDATTQVSDVFVGEEDRGSVGVVVVYDRTVQGDGVDRTESDRYLELDLIHLEGEWLVDNVIDIASSGDLDGAVAPTTTTAPAASSAPTSAPAG